MCKRNLDKNQYAVKILGLNHSDYKYQLARTHDYHFLFNLATQCFQSK